jgi:RNA recognition motif-containing protein
MSDFSNNGRYYNGSRGGNKRNKQNYSNTGSSANNKKPIKDIKDIQKKLDKKLANDNSQSNKTIITSPPPSSSSSAISTTNDNNNNDENPIPVELALNHSDPEILKQKDDSIPSSSSTSNTTEKETITPLEHEDTTMNTEESQSDFLNGFSSDKIENAGKIFIGGLTYETTDEKLREHFEQYGKIIECTVMKDNNNCSRGFGFITYENPEVLDKVLEINHILDGKTVDPKRAIPRDRQDKTEKIFVGGIHPDVTEAEFKKAFDSFGKVIDATLITAKDTGKSRCFGFITYEDGRGVEVAYANRHNIVLNGKKVEVKYAAPKPKPSNGLNPMMLNMNGMNNMNMRLPVGIPMGMGVVNIPPQLPQQMPPPKMTKGNSYYGQYSLKNKQNQKYYQQNMRSGQVGPIRNQHSHAYPQDFQYSRYNLNNMNMYTTYNYNPYSNPAAAGYMSYEYDNYNMPPAPMPGYGNPQPFMNGTAAYPSGYVNRGMGGYPQGSHHSTGSSSGSSNGSHSSYNGHGNNRNSNGGEVNSSNYYYRNNYYANPNANPNANSNSNNNPNYNDYNDYNDYNMNAYNNNNNNNNNSYVPHSNPPVARMNSNGSSSTSNDHGDRHSHHNSNSSNSSHNNMSINDINNNENDMNGSTLYMSGNPRNNHGYHPYSR